MQLRYKYAVISYSPDLTDPDGYSFPVGVVLVGRGDALGVAAAASIPAARLQLNPVATAVVNDLVRALKKQVDDAAAQAGSGDESRIDQIMRSLQQSMRNSLFVSSVSSEIEAKLDGPNELSRLVLDCLVDELDEGIRKLREQHAGGAAYELDAGDKFYPVFAWPMTMAPARDSHP